MILIQPYFHNHVPIAQIEVELSKYDICKIIFVTISIKIFWDMLIFT